MKISKKIWNNYISTLRALDNKAAEDMIKFMSRLGPVTKVADDYVLGSAERKALIEYSYGLATKYGEAAASAACEMYDAVAMASRAKVPAAIPAKTATYGETAKSVLGTLKESPMSVPSTVSRLVKQAGVDTTVQNAVRDGAEWAWVPSGDTCAFCLTLASQGWLPASQEQLDGGHAEHVHANCDCTFAIRFNGSGSVEGYDPGEYRKIYDNAEGTNSKEKINFIRREFYAENKVEINEQKRDAYEKRKELDSSAAEEVDVSRL